MKNWLLCVVWNYCLNITHPVDSNPQFWKWKTTGQNMWATVIKALLQFPQEMLQYVVLFSILSKVLLNVLQLQKKFCHIYFRKQRANVRKKTWYITIFPQLLYVGINRQFFLYLVWKSNLIPSLTRPTWFVYSIGDSTLEL